MKIFELSMLFCAFLMVNAQFGDYSGSSVLSRSRSRYMQDIINQQEKKQRRRHHKKCTFNNVLSCLEPTFQYTHGPNGTGIVSTEQQYDDLCFKMHDLMPHCLGRFLQKCATPFQKQLTELAIIKPFKESTQVLCDKNGPIRNEYLQHSSCVISKVKLSPVYRRTCVRDIQAGFEDIESRFVSSDDADEVSTELASGYGSLCCVYNRWQNCFASMLQQECGPGSDKAIIGFIQQSMMGMIERLCPVDKYGHDSEVCLKSLPKTYPKSPLGIRSRSFGSYFFSLICPNVGYGIIPERD